MAQEVDEKEQNDRVEADLFDFQEDDDENRDEANKEN